MTRCDNCHQEAWTLVQVFENTIPKRWCLRCIHDPEGLEEAD